MNEERWGSHGSSKSIRATSGRRAFGIRPAIAFDLLFALVDNAERIGRPYLFCRLEPLE